MGGRRGAGDEEVSMLFTLPGSVLPVPVPFSGAPGMFLRLHTYYRLLLPLCLYSVYRNLRHTMGAS